MSKNTDHPSKLFITAGGAFVALENGGVNVRKFLQRIIDEPDFRDKVVELADPVRFQPYEGLYDLGAVQVLVEKILESRTTDSFLGENKQQVAKFYENEVILRRLFDRLPARSLQVIELKFGLDGSDPMSNADIATKLGLAESTVSSRVSESIQSLRDMIRFFRLHLDNDDSGLISLIDLQLSDRLIRRLVHTRIYNTRTLLSKTEDDLLAITNLGRKGVDEIIAKLAKQGLALKPPPATSSM